MLVTLFTVKGAAPVAAFKTAPWSQFPFCFRVSARVVFSVVLFLLHRHVLERSLEHPHARIQSRMHRSVHRVVCLVLARRLHSSQHTVVLVELGGG